MYPAPEGWDGSCWSGGIIPGPQAKTGGFYPTTQAPCEPQHDEVEIYVELGWATLVRACRAPDEASSCEAMAACARTPSDPPPAFATCVFQEGEAPECPREYPDRGIFYRTLDSSTIGCSDCRCEPPEGGVCRAFAGVYEDTECSLGALRGGSTASLEHGTCGFESGPSDDPIGSIFAYWHVNEPGTCAPSGGEPFGEAVPEGPVTFCCRPR
ncbi:MAG TPA: hypothetical protein VLS89_15130 [Candidatus Nanopelagicales bacterium]|nr:hypothetical protein [Candidatus Nanopelagicales bacterium]